MFKKAFRKPVLFTGIILLIAFELLAQIPPGRIDTFPMIEKAPKGTPFAPFSVFTTDGKQITDQSLLNKITFINFWFEACAPCIAEMEGLNKLYADHKEKTQFQFLSFTYETKEKIAAIRKKYNIQYPIISIRKDSCYLLNFNSGFPTSIISDIHGKVAFYSCGGPIDPEIAQEIIVDDIYPVLKELLEKRY